MLSSSDGVCVFKAQIIIDGEVVATGHAYEKESSSFINKTSYIENCETSAVGRALGIFGIGIDASIASAEEVTNAINNQKTEKKATAKQKKEIKELINVTGSDVDRFEEFFGYSIDEETEEVAKKMIYELEKKYEKQEKETAKEQN